jgi:hypothetical protein
MPSMDNGLIKNIYNPVWYIEQLSLAAIKASPETSVLTDFVQDSLLITDSPHQTPTEGLLPPKEKLQFFSEAEQAFRKDGQKLHQALDKYEQIQDKYLLNYRRYEQANGLLSGYQEQLKSKNQPPDLVQKVNSLKFEVQRLHASTEQSRWALEQQNAMIKRLQIQLDKSKSHYQHLNNKVQD